MTQSPLSRKAPFGTPKMELEMERGLKESKERNLNGHPYMNKKYVKFGLAHISSMIRHLHLMSGVPGICSSYNIFIR